MNIVNIVIVLHSVKAKVKRKMNKFRSNIITLRFTFTYHVIMCLASDPIFSQEDRTLIKKQNSLTKVLKRRAK